MALLHNTFVIYLLRYVIVIVFIVNCESVQKVPSNQKKGINSTSASDKPSAGKKDVSKRPVHNEADTIDEEKSQFVAAIEEIDGEEILPLKYNSIYINKFISKQKLPADLQDRLKEVLERKFQAQGRLKIEIVRQNADIELQGIIVSYIKFPATYDAFHLPICYLMSIASVIKLGGVGRFKNDSFIDSRGIRYNTAYGPRLPPFETEFQTQERLLKTLADRILYTISEGWYSKLKTKTELGFDPNASEALKEEKEKANSQTILKSSKEIEALIKEEQEFDQSNLLNFLSAQEQKACKGI